MVLKYIEIVNVIFRLLKFQDYPTGISHLILMYFTCYVPVSLDCVVLTERSLCFLYSFTNLYCDLLCNSFTFSFSISKTIHSHRLEHFVDISVGAGAGGDGRRVGGTGRVVTTTARGVTSRGGRSTGTQPTERNTWSLVPLWTAMVSWLSRR